MWQHNFTLNIKGCIWIAWKPSSYEVKVLEKTEQLIHSYITQLNTNKKFYITFVYSMNQEQQRQHLWRDIQTLSQQMTEAWCILGDFNSVLYKEDRMGGNKIQDQELRDFTNTFEICELREIIWTGAYYSWTNKTIWSRIDRVLINIH